MEQLVTRDVPLLVANQQGQRKLVQLLNMFDQSAIKKHPCATRHCSRGVKNPTTNLWFASNSEPGFRTHHLWVVFTAQAAHKRHQMFR